MRTGQGRRRPLAPIERASGTDLMFLAVQAATVPDQFGAVLVLEPRDPGGLDVARVTGILGDRVRAVPRLRQRLQRTPPGCGRPVWVDDAAFALERHVQHVVCPQPGDEQALLDLAADLVARPLPLDRPLWAALFVTGLERGRAAFVVVVQHALADGLGGLAVLGALLDGAPVRAPRDFPVPPPSTSRLAVDALRARVRLLLAAPGRVRDAVRDARRSPRRARGARIGRAGPCSLLVPTGPRRRVAVVRASVDGLRAAGHEHGATVNDVVLTAVAGALHTTLQERGEHRSDFVVAVPVAARTSATRDDPGNRFTETRALLPGAGSPLDRVQRVAAIMRDRKASAMPSWAGAVAGTVVRAAAAVGVHGWYMRRQRYLHTVVSNVRGPTRHQSLGGARVVEIVPLAIGGGGNVTLTFAVLSYAGALTVTVIADPDTAPDLARTAAALQAQFDAMLAATAGTEHHRTARSVPHPGVAR